MWQNYNIFPSQSYSLNWMKARGGAGRHMLHAICIIDRATSAAEMETMSQTQVIITLLLTVALHLVSPRGIFYYKEESEDFSNSSCTGQPNSIQPWTGQPTFVRQIENGTLYTAGDGDDMIYGMYLWLHCVLYAFLFNTAKRYIYISGTVYSYVAPPPKFNRPQQ